MAYTPDPTFRESHQPISSPTYGQPVHVLPDRMDPVGAISTTVTTRLVGGNHEGLVMDTIRWMSGTVDGGAVIYDGTGHATISPGTGSTGSAFLMTSTKARYLTPFPNFVTVLVRTSDEGVDNNIRRWGATDNGVDNHLGFQLSGTQQSIIYKVSGSNEVIIPAHTHMSMSDKVHRYEIWWTRERVEWYADSVLMYTTQVPLTTVTLQVRARATNSDVIPSGSGVIEFHEGSISRQGVQHAQPYYFHDSGSVGSSQLLKKGPGTFYRVAINSIGGNTNSTVTFYDGTGSNGRVIASIQTGKIVNPGTVNFELDFSDGLYSVSQSGSGDCTYVFD